MFLYDKATNIPTLSVCLPVGHLSICLSVCPSVCLSACLSRSFTPTMDVCLSVWLGHLPPLSDLLPHSVSVCAVQACVSAEGVEHVEQFLHWSSKLFWSWNVPVGHDTHTVSSVAVPTIWVPVTYHYCNFMLEMFLFTWPDDNSR